MTRRSKALPYRSHDEATMASFRKDPEFAAEYLNAVLEDSDQRVLLPEILLAPDHRQFRRRDVAAGVIETTTGGQPDTSARMIGPLLFRGTRQDLESHLTEMTVGGQRLLEP